MTAAEVQVLLDRYEVIWGSDWGAQENPRRRRVVQEWSEALAAVSATAARRAMDRLRDGWTAPGRPRIGHLREALRLQSSQDAASVTHRVERASARAPSCACGSSLAYRWRWIAKPTPHWAPMWHCLRCPPASGTWGPWLEERWPALPHITPDPPPPPVALGAAS